MLAIWSALTISWGFVSWVYARTAAVMVRTVQLEVMREVSAEIDSAKNEIRLAINAEGAIRDASDSLQWVSLEQLRKEVRAGVYSRVEIDAMRRASYARQDSIARVLRRRFGR
jgi:hypothetical protein